MTVKAIGLCSGAGSTGLQRIKNQEDFILTITLFLVQRGCTPATASLIVARPSAGIMEHLPRDSFRQDSHAMFRIADGDGSFVKNSVDDDVGGIWDWLQSMAGECDQNMSDVTEEDIANALGGGEGGIMDQKPSFAALDREILSTLVASGGNQSTKNDTWSRRRFDEWRLQNGMPTSKAIETMDIETLASQLPTFFQQVMKHNGDHYPLERYFLAEGTEDVGHVHFTKFST